MWDVPVAWPPGIVHSAGVQAGPLDDSEVLRAVAHGDRDSLGTLYDRHAPAMLALGMRIVGVRREVEDLLHDVFLEAWRHAGDYDPRRGSVKTWLLLRMRSRCLDRVRSHGFSRVDPLLQEPMRSQAADRTERGVDGARVRALVRELPQGQREVLELGYFAGFSFQEIADQLGIPIGTVKSRVSAAMVKLRSELGVPPVSREEAS
jgi:RNA polymerase sigma-70 factor (ECF subfamily)